MSHLPFHQEQLEFMIDLVCHRIEWLEPFFRFLNYFDSPYFFFVLIPTIWLGFSYKWGLRIFYWFTFNNLLLSLAKNSIGWPRPSTDMPELGLYHPTSFGFPSGGAQVSMFLGSLLIYYGRRPLAWAIGIPYILLISFSRLYLGVHYPLDILGGWVFAWLVLALFIYSKEPLEKWLSDQSLEFCLILSLAVPLLILYLFPSTHYVIGSLIGVGIGTYFSLKRQLFLPKPKNLMEGIGRSFMGVSMLFLLVLLIPGTGHFYKSLLAGLFMSLVASPICRLFIDRKA